MAEYLVRHPGLDDARKGQGPDLREPESVFHDECPEAERNDGCTNDPGMTLVQTLDDAAGSKRVYQCSRCGTKAVVNFPPSGPDLRVALEKLLRRFLDNHCQNADSEGMSALCECKLCLDTRAALSGQGAAQETP